MYTVLLGVLDSEASERTFQANIERRVAMLLGEAMGSVRRVKRATIVGNSSVQVLWSGSTVMYTRYKQLEGLRKEESGNILSLQGA